MTSGCGAATSLHGYFQGALWATNDKTRLRARRAVTATSVASIHPSSNNRLARRGAQLVQLPLARVLEAKHREVT